MYVSLDAEQVEVVRDVLRRALSELRVESARADATGFRVMLHHREDVVEAVLAKLSPEARAAI